MKNIIKILFLAVVTVSCSGTDDHTTEGCLNPDLGITAAYANPYPDHVPVYNYYEDWKWTMKNDSTLCIKFEEVQFGEDELSYNKRCFYISIDPTNNCGNLIASRNLITTAHLVDENGNPVYLLENSFNNISSFELQQFNITDEIVGKTILTYDDGDQETIPFWVELNEENHFEFDEFDLNAGL